MTWLQEPLMQSVIVSLLLFPVNSVSLDSGPLCPGQTAVLTCNVPGGITLQWIYNSMEIFTIQGTSVPSSDPIPVDGVEFTVSLLSNTGSDLVSEISFEVSSSINGGVLRCSGLNATAVGSSEVTLQEENSVGPPSDVMVSNMVYGIEQANVTIEWTPPTNGGNVMYTIGTTPGPLSGAIPDTDSTHIDITLNYNITYMVTVAINTTCGVQEATTTFNIAGCASPSLPVNGMVSDLSATNEGAEITYQCGPGFQPQNISTAVCDSNGLWSPDPALHDCTVDCGQPEFNSVVSNVSSTTEGATMTFKCDEGLFPSDPITSTCNSTGQWTPDPADVQCRTPVMTTGDTFSTATTFPIITATNSTSDPGSNSAGIVPIVAGVVVTIMVLIISAILIVSIIVICIRRGSGKKVYRANTELQETPMMEYNTLDTRGYNSPTHDGYSSVTHGTTMGGQVTDEYSTVQHNTIRDKIEFQAAGEEYSQLNTHKVHPGEGYSQLNTHKDVVGGVVYADLGPQSRKKENLIPNSIPEDRVVYSAIDTKATSKHQAPASSPDATLDLNMMLIQVREVIPKWHEYGQAMGVPPEMLKELENMKMGDYEKLVEVLDYWFRQFPQGSQPTWRDVAISLQSVGMETLAADIMKVYTTGQLPIVVSDDVPHEAYGVESEPPPPLPPKIDDEQPPKPKPRVGSLKAAAPPRPPKSNLPPSVSIPPRPSKAGPLLPPKPRND